MKRTICDKKSLLIIKKNKIHKLEKILTCLRK